MNDDENVEIPGPNVKRMARERSRATGCVSFLRVNSAGTADQNVNVTPNLYPSVVIGVSDAKGQF